MKWTVDLVSLDDLRYFETINGLWSGKKPPFSRVGVIRNANFTRSGQIDFTDIALLDVETKQFERRRLLPDDIIIERSGGGPKQPVGRVVQFDGRPGAFSFSNFTSVIRVRERDSVDPRFVFYMLRWLYEAGLTEDIQRHTTGIRNLDFTAYKRRASIPLIPLSEQHTIAAALDMVQCAIERHEHIVTTATELHQALLESLLTAQIGVDDLDLSEGVYEVPCLANRRSMVVPNAVQIMASLVLVSAS